MTLHVYIMVNVVSVNVHVCLLIIDNYSSPQVYKMIHQSTCVLVILLCITENGVRGSMEKNDQRLSTQEEIDPKEDRLGGGLTVM